MKGKFKKLLSVAVCAVMVWGVLPMEAMAATTHENHCECIEAGLPGHDEHSAVEYRELVLSDLTTEAYQETDCYVIQGDNYYLSSDIALDKPIIVKGGVNLCLNGNTLSANGDSGLSTMFIMQNATLSVADCVGSGKIDFGGLSGVSGSKASGLTVNHPNANNIFNLYCGELVSENTGVSLSNHKVGRDDRYTFKVNIEGGKISFSADTFYMSDTQYNTGNVRWDFTIVDGEFNQNGGSFICMYQGLSGGGDINMTGGTLRHNAGGSAAINLGGKTTFTMEGYAKIISTNGGAAVNADYSFVMRGNAKITCEEGTNPGYLVKLTNSYHQGYTIDRSVNGNARIEGKINVSFSSYGYYSAQKLVIGERGYVDKVFLEYGNVEIKENAGVNDMSFKEGALSTGTNTPCKKVRLQGTPTATINLKEGQKLEYSDLSGLGTGHGVTVDMVLPGEFVHDSNSNLENLENLSLVAPQGAVYTREGTGSDEVYVLRKNHAHINSSVVSDYSSVVFDKQIPYFTGSLEMESGGYYLSEDTTLAGNLVIPEGNTVYIDVAEYTLTGSGSGVMIENNGTLHILSCCNKDEWRKGCIVVPEGHGIGIVNNGECTIYRLGNQNSFAGASQAGIVNGSDTGDGVLNIISRQPNISSSYNFGAVGIENKGTINLQGVLKQNSTSGVLINHDPNGSQNAVINVKRHPDAYEGYLSWSALQNEGAGEEAKLINMGAGSLNIEEGTRVALYGASSEQKATGIYVGDDVNLTLPQGSAMSISDGVKNAIVFKGARIAADINGRVLMESSKWSTGKDLITVDVPKAVSISDESIINIGGEIGPESNVSDAENLTVLNILSGTVNLNDGAKIKGTYYPKVKIRLVSDDNSGKFGTLKVNGSVDFHVKALEIERIADNPDVYTEGVVLLDLTNATYYEKKYEENKTEVKGSDNKAYFVKTADASAMDSFANWFKPAEGYLVKRESAEDNRLFVVANKARLDARGGVIPEGYTGFENDIPFWYGVYNNLPTPTRAGYSFDGWYTQASGGEKIEGDITDVSGKTYYAHWTLSGTGSFNVTAAIGNTSSSAITETQYIATYGDSGTAKMEATVSGDNLPTGINYAYQWYTWDEGQLGLGGGQWNPLEGATEDHITETLSVAPAGTYKYRVGVRLSDGAQQTEEVFSNEVILIVNKKSVSVTIEKGSYGVREYDGSTIFSNARLKLNGVLGRDANNIQASGAVSFTDPHAGVNKEAVVNQLLFRGRPEVTNNYEYSATEYTNAVYDANITRKTLTVIWGENPEYTGETVSISVTGINGIVSGEEDLVGIVFGDVYETTGPGEYIARVDLTNKTNVDAKKNYKISGESQSHLWEVLKAGITQVEDGELRVQYTSNPVRYIPTVKWGTANSVVEDSCYTIKYYSIDAEGKIGEAMTGEPVGVGKYLAQIVMKDRTFCEFKDKGNVALGENADTAAEKPDCAILEIVRSISINPLDTMYFEENPIELKVGETYTQAVVNTNTGGSLIYSSNNTDVAEVNDSTGEVTAISPGTAVIKATYQAEGKTPVTAVYTLRVTKELTAEDFDITVATKSYDGLDTATVTATVKAGSLADTAHVVKATAIGSFADVNAGTAKTVTYEITGLSGKDSSKYTLAEDMTGSVNTGVIEKAKVRFNAQAVTTATYDGNPHGVAVSGAVGNLSFDSSKYDVLYAKEIEGSFGTPTADVPVAVGMYKVSVALKASEETNYVIEGTPQYMLSIREAGQGAFSVEGVPANVYYGDSFTLSAPDVQQGANVTYAITAGNDIAQLDVNEVTVVGVGQVTITATSTQSGYGEKTATRSFTALPKALTPTAEATSRSYNGQMGVEVEISLEGIINNDTVTAQATGTMYSADAGSGKQVSVNNITLTGRDKDKYALSTASLYTTVDISKLTITELTVTSANKAYDGSVNAQYTVTAVDEVLAADREQVTVNGAATFEDANVGANKAVTFKATGLSGVKAGNYVIADDLKNNGVSAGSYDITAVPVTITAQKTTTAIYDGRGHGVNVSASAGGQVLDNSMIKVLYQKALANGGFDVATENAPVEVGTYAVTFELNESISDTHEIVSATADVRVVIEKASQGPFYIEGVPETVYYGDSFTLGSTDAEGDVTYAITEGMDYAELNGDTVEIKGVGRVVITATSVKDGYTDRVATKTINVRKAILTPAAVARGRVYNGESTVAVSISLTGKVGSDDVRAEATGSMYNADAGSGKQVSVNNITLTGRDKDKYALSTTSLYTTVNISKKEITGITVSASNKTYDKTDNAQVSVQTMTGLISGDEGYVSVNGTARFNNANAEENKTVTFTATSLSGDKSGNYVLGANAKVVSTTATIEKASVSISCPSNVSFVYDGASHGINFTAISNGMYVDNSSVNVTYRKAGETTGSGTAPHQVGVYSVEFASADNNYRIEGSPIAVLNITSAAQDVFSIENVPSNVVYGDSFTVSTYGRTADSTVTYAITEGTNAATIDADSGEVNVIGTGRVVITATSVKEGYDNRTARASFTAGVRTLEVINLQAEERNYNGLLAVDVTGELSGVVGSDDVSLETTGEMLTADAGVGKAVEVNARLKGTKAGNYVLKNNTLRTTVSISPIEVGFKIAAQNKKFDTTAVAQAQITEITGLLAVDAGQVTVNGVATFEDANAGVDKEVTFNATGLSGLKAGNYTLSSLNAKAKAQIEPMSITFAIGQTGFVYDGNNKPLSVSATDELGRVFNGYSVSYVNGNNENVSVPKDAGSYTASIALDSTNYATSQSTTVYMNILDAAQSQLMIVGLPGTAAYKDTFELEAFGGAEGGSCSWSVEAGSVSLSSNKGEKVQVTVNGMDNVKIKVTKSVPNHMPISAVVSFKPVAKAVKLNISDLVHVYDGDAKTATVSADFTGETVPVKITYNGSTTAPRNVGEYTVLAVSDDRKFAGSAQGVMVINNARMTGITVSEVNDSYVYGNKPNVSVEGVSYANATTEITYTSIGTGVSSAQSPEKAGSYSVTVRVNAPNYEEYVNTQTYRITKALFTVTAQNVSREYGEANPNLELSYSGFVYGENEGCLTELPLAITDANAASPTGEYDITVRGGSAENYSFNYEAGKLTITGSANEIITIVGERNLKYGAQSTYMALFGQAIADVVWSVDNPDMAEIDAQTGVLTAKRSGRLTVIATGGANYPNAEGRLAVTIERPEIKAGGGGGGASNRALEVTVMASEDNPVIKGKGEPNKDIEVFIINTKEPNNANKTGSLAGKTRVGADGTWQVEYPESLRPIEEGEYKITVQYNIGDNAYTGRTTAKFTVGVARSEPVEDNVLLVIQINSTKYILNGKDEVMDSPPFIDKNDRTMLPVRVVANALGIADEDITWDNEEKTATFTRADGVVVSCTVGSNVIKVGDEEMVIDTVPVIVNDRIYLPLRALFNAFKVSDENIIWDGVNRTVTVKKEALGEN